MPGQSGQLRHEKENGFMGMFRLPGLVCVLRDWFQSDDGALTRRGPTFKNADLHHFELSG